MITAKNNTRLQLAAKELGVTGLAGDIRRNDDVESIVKKALDKFGKIDIL